MICEECGCKLLDKWGFAEGELWRIPEEGFFCSRECAVDFIKGSDFTWQYVHRVDEEDVIKAEGEELE